MTAAVQPRRTRSRWAAGCLVVLLSSFLLLGVVYWGYCWGWWGRTNLTLQYLFQCQCPAASEAVRYRPYTVLASACQQPQAMDLSPNGQFLIFDTAAVPVQFQRQDITTKRTTPLPLPDPDITRVYHVDDSRLFVDIRPEEQFFLFDLRDGTQTPLPWIQTHTLDDATLQVLHQTTEIFVFPGYIVALVPNYPQAPDENLVIAIVPGPLPAITQLLDAAGIPYQTRPRPYTTGPVLGAQYSHDGRFWADTEGIALAQTDERIVTLDLPPLKQPTNFRPLGWTPDNRAVVYAAVHANRLMPHLIEMEYLTWRWFPVPQPILLVEVPEEYWATDGGE